MISRNICLLSMLGIFLTLTFIGQLSDAQVTREIKVYVSVECDNENTETLIKSWTKRELRNLLDVNLVGVVDAEVMLILFTKEPKHETGEETGGIVISYTFLERDPTSPAVSPRFYFPDIGLATGDKSEHLENLCKNIVAEFDTKRLESVRIVREVADEILRERYQKSK
jgi:hypothetical protein